MYKTLVLILFLLVAGCEQTDFEKAQENIIEEMGWLYKANPLDDYEEALKRKDFRFIGIYGYSIYVPGVSLKCLDYDKDINPIKGTSDAVIGYEHSKLIAIARTYAEFYNFRMKMYREENHGFECNS